MQFYPSGSIINNRYEVVQGPLEKKSLMGGMGLVYLCADRDENGRPVALKTFQPQFLPDRAARDRFLREGDTWLKLGRHPHIVRCYEVFGLAIGPEVFFALELVAEAEGKKDASLRCWLRPEGIQRPGIALPPEQALRFALHMVRGMKQATTKISGLVHRDLKPENVLVGRDGNARITDFGLASAFQAIGQVKEKQMGEEIPATGRIRTQLTGGIAGTPLYMAPEQWIGKALDVRTDIYAFGCILYEMLTGQLAVDDGSHRSLKEVHQQGWFARNRDQLPPDLVDLLGRCAAVPKEERYKDWAELESVLMVAYEKESGKILPELPVTEVETSTERVATGWSYNTIGTSYFEMGNFVAAKDYFEKMLNVAKMEKNIKLEGAALINMGLAYYTLSEFRLAIENYKHALAITREIRDQYGESAALGNLGNVYTDLGEFLLAIENYEKALAIAREIGDRQGEGNALSGMGNIYYLLDDLPQAIEFHKRRLTISRAIGDRQGEGQALGNLGLAYHQLGEVQQAIEFQEKRLTITREIGDRQGEGEALGNLGIIYSQLGEEQKAITYFEQDLAITRELGDRQGEGTTLGNLGIVYDNLGKIQKAIEYYQQHLAIAEEIGDIMGAARTYLNLAHLYFQGKRKDKALSCAQYAREFFAQNGHQQYAEKARALIEQIKNKLS
jgi:tetratricopeptide (TPR) repeat protein